MRLKLVLMYDIPGDDPADMKAFREEALMMTQGEQGLPGRCVYASLMRCEANEPTDLLALAKRAELERTAVL